MDLLSEFIFEVLIAGLFRRMQYQTERKISSSLEPHSLAVDIVVTVE
jgi:hypothetical protein